MALFCFLNWVGGTPGVFLLLSFILGSANNIPGVKSGQQDAYVWPKS